MNHSTRVCVSLGNAESPEALFAIPAVRRALETTPERVLVELRRDLLFAGDEALWAQVYQRLGTARTVVTCRDPAEGGTSATHSAAARLAVLQHAVRCGVGHVDLELRNASWLETLRHETEQQQQPRIIGSYHDFVGTPGNLPAIVQHITDAGFDVAKIACRVNTADDTLALLQLVQHTQHIPIIAVGMGPVGVVSRVMGARLGAYATFCAPSATETTAPGQPTLTDMLDLYRVPHIDRNTQFYALVGHPLGHSLSPAVHNDAFATLSRNACYVPFAIASDPVPILRKATAMGLCGASVTIPHKEALMQLTQDTCDPIATRVGALNTLVCDTNERWHGHNTDSEAAFQTLAEPFRTRQRALDSQTRVLILGAGGVARAIIAALAERGITGVVVNRSPPRAATLARAFGFAHAPLHALDGDGAALGPIDVVVNATSVGMSPSAGSTPLPTQALAALASRRAARGDGMPLVVFDSVYNPRETLLLAQAARHGAIAVTGDRMFVLQALAQQRLWWHAWANRVGRANGSPASPDWQRIERDMAALVADNLALPG